MDRSAKQITNQLCTYATGRPPRVPLILMGDKAPLQCRKYVYGFVLDNPTCYLVWPERNSVNSCHVLHTSTENALALKAPFFRPGDPLPQFPQHVWHSVLLKKGSAFFPALPGEYETWSVNYWKFEWDWKLIRSRSFPGSEKTTRKTKPKHTPTNKHQTTTPLPGKFAKLSETRWNKGIVSRANGQVRGRCTNSCSFFLLLHCGAVLRGMGTFLKT